VHEDASGGNEVLRYEYSSVDQEFRVFGLGSDNYP
jgi:hypothetical protein